MSNDYGGPLEALATILGAVMQRNNQRGALKEGEAAADKINNLSFQQQQAAAQQGQQPAATLLQGMNLPQKYNPLDPQGNQSNLGAFSAPSYQQSTLSGAQPQVTAPTLFNGAAKTPSYFPAPASASAVDPAQAKKDAAFAADKAAHPENYYYNYYTGGDADQLAKAQQYYQGLDHNSPEYKGFYQDQQKQNPNDYFGDDYTGGDADATQRAHADYLRTENRDKLNGFQAAYQREHPEQFGSDGSYIGSDSTVKSIMGKRDRYNTYDKAESDLNKQGSFVSYTQAKAMVTKTAQDTMNLILQKYGPEAAKLAEPRVKAAVDAKMAEYGDTVEDNQFSHLQNLLNKEDPSDQNYQTNVMYDVARYNQQMKRAGRDGLDPDLVKAALAKGSYDQKEVNLGDRIAVLRTPTSKGSLGIDDNGNPITYQDAGDLKTGISPNTKYTTDTQKELKEKELAATKEMKEKELAEKARESDNANSTHLQVANIGANAQKYSADHRGGGSRGGSGSRKQYNPDGTASATGDYNTDVSSATDMISSMVNNQKNGGNGSYTWDEIISTVRDHYGDDVAKTFDDDDTKRQWGYGDD